MDVENWKLRIRAVTERFFDLAGFSSSPRNQAPYRVSNDVVRALAHLAGHDGTHSRLLRCDEGGRQQIRIASSVGECDAFVDYGALQVTVKRVGVSIVVNKPSGCMVVSPSAEVLKQAAAGDVIEGVLNEMDFGTVADRIVEISVGPGGTDAVIEIGSRTISGVGGVILYALAKGSFVRVQWQWQYLYIHSVTGDGVVYVRWWNL